MVSTNDDELAGRIRLMTNFGFAGYDNVIYIGTNGKMSEASAAMGLTNLESVAEFIARNRQNYLDYCDGLKGIPGIKLWRYSETESRNFQYIAVEVDVAVFGLTRDQLMAILWSENVLVRRYFFPGCHMMEPYRSFYPHARLLLSNTERLCDRILLFPTGTSIAQFDIAKICGIVKDCNELASSLASLIPSRVGVGISPISKR